MLLGDPGGDREREALLEEGGDLADDVVVARRRPASSGLSLHVHQADVRAGVGDHTRQVRVCRGAR